MKRGSFTITGCNRAGITAVTADSAYGFARHTHDQFGVGLILRGAQSSMSGRGTVEAVAGDVITVNPGEVHDGLPLDPAGRAWMMLYFEPEVFGAFLSDLTDTATAGAELIHPRLRDAATASQLRRMFHALTAPPAVSCHLSTGEALALVLTRLVTPRGRLRPQRGIPASVLLARQRIDDDPTQPLTLEDLAEITGLSRFQVLRAFTRLTGLTPHAYLVQRRLQAARRLLANGEAIAGVAQTTGFADQSHMTRLFGRSYGLSPGQYAVARAGACNFVQDRI